MKQRNRCSEKKGETAKQRFSPKFCTLLQVEQILNPKTGKLDHKVKFDGNPVFEKSYNVNEVFTGILTVHVSDPWNVGAGKCRVRKFIYEILE